MSFHLLLICDLLRKKSIFVPKSITLICYGLCIKIIAFKVIEFRHNAQKNFNVNRCTQRFFWRRKVCSFTFIMLTLTLRLLKMINQLPPNFDVKLCQLCCICRTFDLILQDDLRYITPQLTITRQVIVFIYVSLSHKQTFASIWLDSNLSDRIFAMVLIFVMVYIYMVLIMI